MTILQQQFVLNYEISGGTVRIQPGGEFTNDRGEKIAYPCSVKITSVNMIEGDINPATNFPDTIQSVCVFKIPCDNMIEAGNVARYIQPLLLKGDKIILTGKSAIRKADGTFEATVDKPNLDKKK